MEIKKIFLKIAGFNVLIIFVGSEDNQFFKDELINKVEKYLKGFIVQAKEIKEDFTIEIKQEENNKIIYKQKDKSFYFQIFKIQKKAVYCSYEISLSQLIFIIRYIILQLLSSNSGFLMHGSSVVIDGKAYVFTGPPGAGKSTIMKMLSSRYPVIADDSVIIKKKNGEYSLYQTPMIEKETWVVKKSNKYLLGGIFFLNQSKEIKIEKMINKKETIEKLVSQLFVNQDQVRKQIGKIMNFVKKFDQFGTMYFSKDQKKLLRYFSNNKI